MNVVITYIASEVDSPMELKYVLRSLAKNLLDAFVYLIGDKPLWYQGNHIPHTRLPLGEERNYLDAQAKLKEAAKLLPDFVWWMDDQFLVKPIEEEWLKVPRNQPLFVRETEYGKVKKRTLDKLKQLGKTQLDYGTHLPFYFESQKLLALESLGWGKRPALLTDCLYYNYYDCKPTMSDTQALFRIKRNTGAIQPAIIWNTQAGMFNKIEFALAKMFPEKSRYEG